MKPRFPLLVVVLVAAVVALAIIGCTPSRFPDTTPTRGDARLVTRIATYATLDDVPRALADLVPWGTPRGAVTFAVAGGAYCYVPLDRFTALAVGRRLTCPWRWPRGG